MTQEEKDERYQKLMTQPIRVLIELIIKLEDEVAKTKDYRRRLMQIRNIALDPDERRAPGRPKRNMEED